MRDQNTLPFPVLDALHLGAHRLYVLTDQDLFASCGVRVMFTGRAGGVSEGPFASLNCSLDVGDAREAVLCNRLIVCEAADADSGALVSPKQVHGTRIVMAGSLSGTGAPASGHEAAREEADGVLVEERGVPAMLLSADCLLLVVVSPTGRFVLAHAGWRGALGHIARAAVEALAQADARACSRTGAGDCAESPESSRFGDPRRDALRASANGGRRGCIKRFVRASVADSATCEAISVGTLSERPPAAVDGRSESVPTKVTVPGANTAHDTAPYGDDLAGRRYGDRGSDRPINTGFDCGAGRAVDTFTYNAYIGPHICGSCFEVGEDVEESFRDEFGERAIAGARHVSLAGAVTSDLLACGLDERRIADASVCTKCDSDRYFSYRASGGACGRNAAFAYASAGGLDFAPIAQDERSMS